MVPEALTEKEEKIYGFIKSYFDKHGRPPTYAEIRDKFNYSAISSVQDFISQLKNKGYIQAPIGTNKKRALELVEDYDSDVAKVVLSGTVAAGHPIEAIETRDYVDVPRNLLKKNGDYFALKVKGDSMIEDCIMEGDVVVIKRQSTASNGQTVVAILDNEATIKRFYQKKNRIELHPANPNFDIIKVPEESEFKILGVLASVIRRVE